MNYSSVKNKVAIMLVATMLLTSCGASSRRQDVVDNIIPDYKVRMYTVADLIPYTYKEIRNAQAFYGKELSDFFNENTATEAVVKRTTKEEEDAFNRELMYRNHNYKTIKKRFAMYVGDGNQVQEDKEADRQKEYDDYYKLENAEGASVIKKYNDGKISGMPLMSIRVDMSTATMSSLDSLYSQALCEIYEPVYIENSVYKRLKFGDTIDLVVPATNSTVGASETKKVTCTYVATDSLAYTNEDGNESYYFLAYTDGTNDVRRVLNYYGETLETYKETAMLQFMKYARVARANEPQRLMIAVAQDNLTEYNFDELAVRALSGGYLVYDYKDYVYANSVTTNLKGYITSLVEYDNQRIDNEFYNSK